MHQAKRKNPSKKTHVLRWIREQLGFTQFDVARMIGSSQPTIQSIELGRLKLSERFAYKLGDRLGLDPKWLLANSWENLPKPEKLRKDFQQVLGLSNQDYEALINLRLHLFQSYLLLRTIVDELGGKGFNATGFGNILHGARLDLLSTIADKKLREELYQKFINRSAYPIKSMSLVISDAREIQRHLKESGFKDRESKEPNQRPDEAS